MTIALILGSPLCSVMTASNVGTTSTTLRNPNQRAPSAILFVGIIVGSAAWIFARTSARELVVATLAAAFLADLSGLVLVWVGCRYGRAKWMAARRGQRQRSRWVA
jgi:hypothetical protein